VRCELHENRPVLNSYYEGHTHTQTYRDIPLLQLHERGGHGQPDRHVGWEHLEKSVWIDWRGGWRIIFNLISGHWLLGRYGLQLIIYISIPQFVSRPDYRLSGMRFSAIFFIPSRQMLGQYFDILSNCLFSAHRTTELVIVSARCTQAPSVRRLVASARATQCSATLIRAKAARERINWVHSVRAMYTGAFSEEVSGECQSNTMQRDTN
jgi:hypothetical protein